VDKHIHSHFAVILQVIKISFCLFAVNVCADLTELSIEGDNKTNLVILVRKVGYTNTRQFPTPGRRNLHLSTTVT
jgi:hypothetical protein